MDRKRRIWGKNYNYVRSKIKGDKINNFFFIKVESKMRQIEIKLSKIKKNEIKPFLAIRICII